jgi:hypothetical protein
MQQTRIKDDVCVLGREGSRGEKELWFSKSGKGIVVDEKRKRKMR